MATKTVRLLFLWGGIAILLYPGATRGADADRPQLFTGHSIDLKKPADAYQLPFTPADHLRIAMDPIVKTTLVLGEPLVLSLRLINHTDFTLTAEANFNPRAGLKVLIQPSGQNPRRYEGPYLAGSYLPQEYMLYPYEERPITLLVWGDNATENGLAFPAPGTYNVQLQMELGAKGMPIRGTTWPLDPNTLGPQPPLRITVVPPPKEFAPLVETLLKAKAFPDIHLRRLPPAIADEVEALVAQYPATPISPYLTHILGIRYDVLGMKNPGDIELKNKAGKYFQMTALADSAVKSDAFEALLHLYDRWGLGAPAHKACVDLLRAVDPQIAPLLGNSPIVKKYLINSAEMDPVKYWDILN